MEINDALINKLAMLSRLDFKETEKEEIKKDLTKMIRFVDKLNEFDTSGIEPLLHISSKVNVLREDIPLPTFERAQAMANSPVSDDEFFKVPKVICKQS